MNFQKNAIWSISLILIAATTSVSTTSAASAIACAQFYQFKPAENYAIWLEGNSRERTQWIEHESGTTLKTLQASPNYKTISDAVLSFGSQPRYLSFDSNSKAEYYLRYLGINKPQVLMRKAGDTFQDVLDTRTLKKDGSFALLKAYASPNDNFVVIKATDNGNIDVFNLYVYDLSQKKVVKEFLSSGSDIFWKNDKEFFFYDASERTPQKNTDHLKIFNVESGSLKRAANQNLLFIDKVTYVEFDEKSNVAHLHKKGLKKIALPKNYFNSDTSITSVYQRDNGEIIISTQNPWENISQILKFKKTNTKNHWELVYRNSRNEVIEFTQYHPSHIEVSLFWGPTIITKAIDYSGKELLQVKAPNCCEISHINFKQNEDIVTVTLNSHFKRSVPFKYSIKEGRFLDPTIENKMLSYDGKDYTSSIHWATSADGTKIPGRLTYRKNLNRNEDNPFLINEYGGFMLSGHIFGFDPTMDAFFIKNGGIIGAPALRGGNEFGKPWHESAMFEKKYKTMEDADAFARMVHDLRLSQPKKTAIQGWSNGGFIASATGLRFPKTFGIVIAGNGVNDQLRKEVVDENFGTGWSYEYGDSRIPSVRRYLKNWSPVYKAQQALVTPKVLSVNGRLDSRVDTSHSLKLVHALKHYSLTPENVSLLSIPNSGHWMTSVYYQNTIGWKAQTLIWTYLFDNMGMTASFEN